MQVDPTYGERPNLYFYQGRMLLIKKLIFYRITYPLCQTIKLPINQITTTDDRRSPI